MTYQREPSFGAAFVLLEVVGMGVAEMVREHAARNGVHTAMALAMLAAALAADPRPVRVPQTMRASNGRTYDTEREVDAEIVDCFRNTHSPMDWHGCTGGCDLCEAD